MCSARIPAHAEASTDDPPHGRKPLAALVVEESASQIWQVRAQVAQTELRHELEGVEPAVNRHCPKP